MTTPIRALHVNYPFHVVAETADSRWRHASYCRTLPEAREKLNVQSRFVSQFGQPGLVRIEDSHTGETIKELAFKGHGHESAKDTSSSVEWFTKAEVVRWSVLCSLAAFGAGVMVNWVAFNG